MSSRGVHLLTIDNEIVAVTHCSALQAGQVGSSLRLGETQSEDYLSSNHSRDEILFLLLGACG